MFRIQKQKIKEIKFEEKVTEKMKSAQKDVDSPGPQKGIGTLFFLSQVSIRNAQLGVLKGMQLNAKNAHKKKLFLRYRTS